MSVCNERKEGRLTDCGNGAKVMVTIMDDVIETVQAADGTDVAITDYDSESDDEKELYRIMDENNGNRSLKQTEPGRVIIHPGN